MKRPKPVRVVAVSSVSIARSVDRIELAPSSSRAGRSRRRGRSRAGTARRARTPADRRGEDSSRFGRRQEGEVAVEGAAGPAQVGEAEAFEVVVAVVIAARARSRRGRCRGSTGPCRRERVAPGKLWPPPKVPGPGLVPAKRSTWSARSAADAGGAATQGRAQGRAERWNFRLRDCRPALAEMSASPAECRHVSRLPLRSTRRLRYQRAAGRIVFRLNAGQDRHSRGRRRGAVALVVVLDSGGGRQECAAANCSAKAGAQTPPDPRRTECRDHLAAQRRQCRPAARSSSRSPSKTSSLSPHHSAASPSSDEGHIRFQLHRVPNCVAPKKLQPGDRQPARQRQAARGLLRLPPILGAKRRPRRTARRRRQLFAGDPAGDLLPRPAARLLPHRHQPGQQQRDDDAVPRGHQLPDPGATWPQTARPSARRGKVPSAKARSRAGIGAHVQAGGHTSLCIVR